MKIVLDEDAKMPNRAHRHDAGYDLFARCDFIIPKKDDCYLDSGFAVHDTGVHIAIPRGYVGFLKSKSGLNVNHDIVGEGVIDSGYTGPIIVKLYNHGKSDYLVHKGDKIIQLVILPIFTDELEQVDTLEITARGDNGFGSTGK